MYLLQKPPTISSFIFFLFVFIFACLNIQDISAKYTRMEKSAIAKSDSRKIPMKNVKSFESSESALNSNDNEDIGYSTSSTSDIDESLRSATPLRHHHKHTSRHEKVQKKHNKKNHRIINRHQHKSSMLGSLKEKIETHSKQPVPEPTHRTKETRKLCSACKSNSDAVKKIRYQMFIKTLADKLRVTPEQLTHTNRTRPYLKLPKELIEESMHDSPQEQIDDNYYATVKKVILRGRDMGKQCISQRTTGCYRFDLKENVADLISGQLWVYKTPDRNDYHRQTFVLYMLEIDSNGLVHAERLIRHQTNVRKGWVVIPFRSMRVQAYINKELMIAVRCTTCANKHYRSLYGAKHKHSPLLLVENNDRPLKLQRHKRDISSDDDCDPQVRCCRRSLRIDLSAVHFFFSEGTFDVGYCEGHCDIPDTTNANRHGALLQSYLRRNESVDVNLNFCCVPIDYKAQSIRIEQDDGFQMIHVPKMIATRCGCM